MQRGLDRAVWILLTLAFACLLAAAMPVRSFAEGTKPMGFQTGKDSIGPYKAVFEDHRAADKNIAYCLDYGKQPPTEPGEPEFTIYDQGWDWARTEINSIAFYGYPNETTIGGIELSPTDARAATQFALWMAQGHMSVEGIMKADGNDFASGSDECAKVVRAAAALFMSVDNGELVMDEPYAKRYRGARREDGSSFQAMLWVPSQITVQFKKVSSKPDITDRNEAYGYAGAKYDIFRSTDKEKVGTVITDASGIASLTLYAGIEYYAMEIKAPPAFLLNEERKTFLAERETVVELADEPRMFDLTIKKVDSATGSNKTQPGLKLSGAEFTLTSKALPSFTRKGTTNAAGETTFKGVPFGAVEITEAKAPAGYIQADSITASFTAEELPTSSNGTRTITIRENVMAFDIRINKFAVDSNNGTPVDIPAEGVVFEIVSETTGEVVGTVTSDANGVAATSGTWLGIGERTAGIAGSLPYDPKGYTLREVRDTTPEGYQPCKDITVSPTAMSNGKVLEYTVRNLPIDEDKPEDGDGPEHGEPVAEIDKRQQAALTDIGYDGTEAGRFVYTLDFRSVSDSPIDQFSITDELSSVRDGLCEFVGITTPQTQNDIDGFLDVWYRVENATEGSEDDWRLWYEMVPAQTASFLSASELDLGEDELITAVRIDFGKVGPGFTTRHGLWDRDGIDDESDFIESLPDLGDGPCGALIHMRLANTLAGETRIVNEALAELTHSTKAGTSEKQVHDKVVQVVAEPPEVIIPSADTQQPDPDAPSEPPAEDEIQQKKPSTEVEREPLPQTDTLPIAFFAGILSAALLAACALIPRSICR